MTPLPSPSGSSSPNPLTTILHSAWHGVWLAATSSPLVAVLLGAAIVVAVIGGVRSVMHGPGRRDPVRLFTRGDKAVLLARAGQRCERHGWVSGRCKVIEGLEADHVHPHSRGGQTALANGQALCQRHNRAKRASVPFGWQLKALEKRRGRYYPPGVSGAVARRRRADLPPAR
jgi:HNH endonuclease